MYTIVDTTNLASISTVTLMVFGFIIGAACFCVLGSITYCVYYCCFPISFNQQYQQHGVDGSSQHAIVNLTAFNDARALKLFAKNQATQLPQRIFDSTSNTNDVFETSRICMICLSDYGTGEVLIDLPCKHSFHYQCAAKWLNTSSKCPFCNYLVLK